MGHTGRGLCWLHACLWRRPVRCALLDAEGEAHSSSSSYLHSCDPPIIHGNLTCDTIFIQHNGLIKIGSGKERLLLAWGVRAGAGECFLGSGNFLAASLAEWGQAGSKCLGLTLMG